MRKKVRPVYLSPHLDDVVLSCGGLIHQQVRHGAHPLVITCFAGVPDYGELSPFAAEQHQRWGEPQDPIGQRRREDAAALAYLEAACEHWDYLDCIYRRDPVSGEFLYASEEALWGAVASAEARLIDELSARLRETLAVTEAQPPLRHGGQTHRSAPTSVTEAQPALKDGGQTLRSAPTSVAGTHAPLKDGGQTLRSAPTSVAGTHAPLRDGGQTHRSAPTGGAGARIYAPLAVGQHVDHQIVLRVALQLRRRGVVVQFYEDYPYAEDRQKLALALQGWSSAPLPAIQELTEGDLQAKAAAIRLYGSQLEVLFGEESSVAERVKAYAVAVGGNQGYGERYWEGGSW